MAVIAVKPSFGIRFNINLIKIATEHLESATGFTSSGSTPNLSNMRLDLAARLVIFKVELCNTNSLKTKISNNLFHTIVDSSI